MKEGDVKLVNFGGIVRNTSGSIGADGEMEEMINLRRKDGSLRPMSDNRLLPGLEHCCLEYRYIYIHNNDYQHFVGYREGKVWYFAYLGDAGVAVELSEPVVLMSVVWDDAVELQYCQTGNVLNVVDGGGIHYFLWRKDRYVSVPSDYNGEGESEEIAPEFQVDFRVANKFFGGGGYPMVRAVESKDAWVTPWGNNAKAKGVASVSEREAYAVGLMRASRAFSKEMNEPTGYFLLCTALKLYDGSYVLMSRPVLMMPPNVVNYAKRDDACYNVLRFWETNSVGDSVVGATRRRTSDDGEQVWEMGLYGLGASSSATDPIRNSAMETTLYRFVKDGGLTRNVYFKRNGNGRLSNVSVFRNQQVQCCSNYIPDLQCVYGYGSYVQGRAPFQALSQVGDAFFDRMVEVVSEKRARSAGLIDSAGRPLYDNVRGRDGGDYEVELYNNFGFENFLIPSGCRGEGVNAGKRLYCMNMPSEIQMRIHRGIDSAYEDIVESVCVFMTRELEPTALDDSAVRDKLQSLFVHCSYLTERDCVNGGSDYSLISGSSDLFSRNKDGGGKHDPNFGENFYVPLRDVEEIKEELHREHNFYKIAEIKLKDFRPGGWQRLEIDAGVFKNLVSQEVLKIDASDRSSYRPRVSLMYNGRLHFANYSRSLFLGYPLQYFFNMQQNVVGDKHYADYVSIGQYSRGEKLLMAGVAKGVLGVASDWLKWKADAHPALCVEVDIDTNEGVQTVRRYCYHGSGAMRVYNLNAMLSYPDNRAKEMRIVVQGIGKLRKLVHVNGVTQYVDVDRLWIGKGRYALRPHGSFDFSYYVSPALRPIELDWSESVDGAEVLDYERYKQYLYVIDKELSGTEEVVNGLRASATDNPLYFPYANTWRVGNQQIVGMAVNAEAVGEGQTGAAPLYVFATDGVYGLFVDAGGQTVYNNSRAISREVCNNRKSITYVNIGVAFSSANGIMILRGEELLDVTDSLEGDYMRFADDAATECLPIAVNAMTNERLTDLLPAITNERFLDYCRNGCIIGFNYYDKELYISNPLRLENGEYKYPYSYVIDLKHGFAATKRDIVVEQYIQNYPDTYMLRDGRLEVLGLSGDRGNECMFLTRPLKFGFQNFKQAMRVVLRGYLSVNSGIDHVLSVRSLDMRYSARCIDVDALCPEELCMDIRANGAEVYKMELSKPRCEEMEVYDGADVVSYTVHYGGDSAHADMEVVFARGLAKGDVADDPVDIGSGIYYLNGDLGVAYETHAPVSGTFDVVRDYLEQSQAVTRYHQQSGVVIVDMRNGMADVLKVATGDVLVHFADGRSCYTYFIKAFVLNEGGDGAEVTYEQLYALYDKELLLPRMKDIAFVKDASGNVCDMSIRSHTRYNIRWYQGDAPVGVPLHQCSFKTGAIKDDVYVASNPEEVLNLVYLIHSGSYRKEQERKGVVLLEDWKRFYRYVPGQLDPSVVLEDGCLYAASWRGNGTVHRYDVFEARCASDYVKMPASAFVADMECIVAQGDYDSAALSHRVYVKPSYNALHFSPRNIVFGTSDAHYPYLEVVNKTVNPYERYRVVFGDNGIDAFDFLKKCRQGGYEWIDVTDLPGDVVHLEGQRNYKIRDAIAGKTYAFFCKHQERVKYKTLVERIGRGYYEAKHTLASTTLGVRDGEVLCVLYGGKRYDVVYRGAGTISAQELVDNLQGYQSVPPVNEDKQLSVLTNKWVRFVDLDGRVVDFRLSQKGAMRQRSVYVSFTYKALRSALRGKADSVASAAGTLYMLSYVDDLLATASERKAGVYVFGSYDARRWAFLGGNELGKTFRDLGCKTERVDCKYFRILFVGNLSANSSIEYCELSSMARLLENKIR